MIGLFLLAASLAHAAPQTSLAGPIVRAAALPSARGPAVPSRTLERVSAFAAAGHDLALPANAALFGRLEALLAEELAAEGIPQWRLDALPDDYLRELVERASLKADAQAEDDARARLKDFEAGPVADAAAELSLQLRALLRRDPFSLTPGSLERLSKAESALSGPRTRRLESALSELARRVDQGTFDDERAFRRVDGGWTLLEEGAAGPVYPTFAAAAEALMARARSLPNGPWQADMYQAVYASINDPAHLEQAEAEKADTHALFHESFNAASAANNDDQLFSARRNAYESHPAYDFYKPIKPRTVKRLIAHYEDLAQRAESLPAVARWRIAGSLARGRQGAPLQELPSIERLESLRLRVIAREGRKIAAGLWMLTASAALGVWSAVHGLPLGQAALAALILGALPALYAAWHYRKRARLRARSLDGAKRLVRSFQALFS